MYKTTGDFPRNEMFGLTSQMRRASTSIPANIAEGRTVGGGRFLHHLRIALGSEAELQTQIELSVRQGFLTAERASIVLEQSSEVGRMLHGLHDALKRRQARVRVTQATGVLLFLHATGSLWS